MSKLQIGDESMAKVAAVIVTYNRLEELKKNINMLIIQKYYLDAIYIIDNASNDNTPKFIHEYMLKEPRIKYFQLEKNLGGAGGFAYGLKQACQDGFEWVWLMDDDGRPQDENTLAVLMNVANQQRNYSLINCNVLHNGNDLSFAIGCQDLTLEKQRENVKNGIIYNCACVFNGSLVGKEVFDKIGNIKEEYFIRGDEVEYLMRCKNNGVNIMTVVESLYYHPRTEYVHLKFLRKSFDYEVMPIWKQYFLIRNYVATYFSTANRQQKRTIKRGIELILLGVILHQCSFKRIKYCLEAISDGKKGKFDNYFRGNSK